MTIFDDGSDKLNVRFIIEDENVCHYLETCCDPENVLNDGELMDNNDLKEQNDEYRISRYQEGGEVSGKVLNFS